MSKVRLCDYEKSRKGMHPFKVAVLEVAGDDVLYVDNPIDFLCRILNCIEEFGDKVIPEQKSIEEYCLKVLKHFGLKEKELEVKLFKLTEGGKEEIVSKGKKLETQSDRFMYHILNLKELPFKYYLPMKRAIESEMLSISELIKKYEQNEMLNAIQKNNGVPRNDNEKTIWDFYQRCIVGQREILDFYLNGIKNRVIQKASIKLFHFDIEFLEQYRDHPYKYGQYYYENYFDYEKIEKVRHRFSDADYPEAIVDEMAELYTSKKEEYYKRLNVEYPVEKVFNEYDYYLGRIVSKTNRKEIFAELKVLYQNKNWFGFYALALTQVEGLFTEMQTMVEDKRKRSLSDKVNALRQKNNYNPSLDYYEYHIPNLRNKFLHVGHDNEIEWKSKDLLYDLSHILRLYTSIDNPYQQLVNLIKNRKQEEFSTIEEVLRYIGLLEEISKKRKDQFEQIKEENEKFEREFLIPYCDIDFLAEDLILTLPQKIETLVEECKQSFDKVGVVVDMKQLNYNQLKSLLEIESNVEKIRDVFVQGDKFVEIVQAKVFLETYKKWIPSLPTQIIEDLGKYYSANREMLAKLELFYNKI